MRRVVSGRHAMTLTWLRVSGLALTQGSGKWRGAPLEPTYL